MANTVQSHRGRLQSAVMRCENVLQAGPVQANHWKGFHAIAQEMECDQRNTRCEWIELLSAMAAVHQVRKGESHVGQFVYLE